MTSDLTTKVGSDSASGQTPGTSKSETLVPGTNIGRYRILELVGSGGMGQVYAAYDPELDRKVAVKLLRSADHGTDAAVDELRLLREAQAMAKLTHPNVLAVYDTGKFEGRIFIAMEFVEGDTIGAWIERQQPAWREILSVFIAAGRGLAAAHGVGLVHRDFKPSNVMRHEDGTIRVLDFGLARRQTPTDSAGPDTVSRDGWPRPAEPSGSSSRPSLDLQLSQAGTISGTPGYMAPEQFRGAPIDGRTDQFAFCIALYEALYGERPFGRHKFLELAAAVNRGRVADAPAGTRVPHPLRQVLLRGLSVEPEDRFRDMAQLLAALERVATPWHRRPVAWAALASVATAGTAAALLTTEPAPDPCPDARPQLEGIWDTDRRERIAAAFEASTVPYAADAFARTAQALDTWAQHWVEAHHDACEATHVRHEQSEALLDRRMSCLHSARAELDVLTSMLLEADAQAVEKSVAGALGLTGVEPCADLETLSSALPPPDDSTTRAAVDELRAELAGIDVLVRAGRVKQAMEHATALLERASAIGYEPVIAEARYTMGRLQGATGAMQLATETLDAALMSAVGLGHVGLEYETRVALVPIHGYRLRNFEAAEEQARFARALRQRFTPSSARAGTLEISEALVEWARGNHERALELIDEGLVIKRENRGATHPDVAGTLVNKGAFLGGLERIDEAADTFRAAIEIYRTSFGPRHPEVAMATHNLGLMFLKQGKFDEAERLIAQALDVWNEVLPPGDLNVASAEQNLGILKLRRGDPAAALAHHERAIAIKTQALGAGHPQIGQTRNNVVDTYNALERYQDAVDQGTQALAEVEPLGEGNPVLGQVLGNLAEAEVGAGQWDSARAHAERAMAIFAATPSDPADVADARFVLARISRARGDEAAATAQARSALELFLARGPFSAPQAAEVRRFLGE